MPGIFQRRCIGALFLLASSVIGANGAGAGETLDRIARTGQVVLTARNSVPFSYLNVNGAQIGYTVDICMKIVDAIRAQLKQPSLSVKFVQVTPSSRFQMIMDGKADLECGPSTNNAERRKLVSFTVGNFIATGKMIVKTNSGIRNWPDLHDKVIVTTAATTNAQSIAARNNVRALNITLIEAKEDPESFRNVQDGKADAFAMDDVLLYGLRANAPNPADYVIVGDPLTVEMYAISFSKKDSDLKKIVDVAMARMIDSKEIFKLYEKWFQSPIPPNGINLNMPMSPWLRSSFEFPSDGTSD